MTATEVLRRMLDERGVEHYDGTERTLWGYEQTGEDTGIYRFAASEISGGFLQVDMFRITPEQAIAATLGPAVRHPKPHEQWTTVLLPEIAWGWDDRWPDYLSVAHDARGEWRVYVPEATLGSCNCSDNCTNGERTETCHPVISDNLTESEGTGDAWADCSECGHLLFVLTDPNSQVPNFCPNCGAKVVEPTTNDVDVEVDA